MYHSLSLMVVGKTNDIQISSTNSPTHKREIRYLFMYIDESFLRFQRHVEYNASINPQCCRTHPLQANSVAKLDILFQLAKHFEFFSANWKLTSLENVTFVINSGANLTKVTKRNNGIFLMMIRESPIKNRGLSASDIVIGFSPCGRTASPLPTDCESEAYGLGDRVNRTSR